MRRLVVVLALALLSLPLCERSQAAAPWRPRLVVLVAVDTLRADHLGAYGYARPVSPSIDRLAAQGTVFTHAYSQSNESLFSYASLFSGRYPRAVGPLSHAGFRLPSTFPSLPATLAAHGLQTAAFVAGGYLDHEFGFSHGFEVYEDASTFGSFYHTMPAAFEWLEARPPEGPPSLLFVHGYDLHEPYGKPMFFDHLYHEGYRGVADDITARCGAIERVYKDRWYRDLPREAVRREVLLNADAADPMHVVLDLAARGGPSVPLAPADVAQMVAAYDGALTYADVWVGLLVARLQRLGLLEQTLLVLIGDHGEELHERGVFGHRLALNEATLHVPLVLWAPGHVPAARRVDEVVELRALSATLRDYLGVESGEASLRPLVEGARASAEGVAVSEAWAPQACIRSGGRRLVYAGGVGEDESAAAAISRAPLDAAHFALFDLARDPDETRNLLDDASSREEAERLREQLVRRLEAAR